VALFASAVLGWRFEAALGVVVMWLALIAGRAWGSENAVSLRIQYTISLIHAGSG
jgi:hypothetical protein